MRNICKITVLFLTSVLLFISITTENYCIRNDSFLQGSGTEIPGLYKSPEKADLFVVNRHGEKLVASYKNLPVPNLKNQIYDFYSDSLPSEKRKIIISTEYLFHAEAISRNLEGITIIYPFHSFW